MRISYWSSDVCSSDLDVPSDLPIPQLTLQPLLENALIYGIQPSIEGGLVRVDASYREGVFHLCVSNPSQRSEARRVGNESVSTCRSRRSPDHEKKKT